MKKSKISLNKNVKLNVKGFDVRKGGRRIYISFVQCLLNITLVYFQVWLHFHKKYTNPSAVKTNATLEISHIDMFTMVTGT